MPTAINAMEMPKLSKVLVVLFMGFSLASLLDVPVQEALPSNDGKGRANREVTRCEELIT